MTSNAINLRLVAIFASALLYAVLLVSKATADVPADVPAEAVWIDVRTPAEYQQGHLEQATLIPFDGIEKGVVKLQLDKDAPIYLYCAVGGRAEKARQTLLSKGYTQVVNVGGLEQARQLAAESE